MLFYRLENVFMWEESAAKPLAGIRLVDLTDQLMLGQVYCRCHAIQPMITNQKLFVEECQYMFETDVFRQPHSWQCTVEHYLHSF